MIRLDDIYSLTAFQRHTKAHIARLKQTGRPEVLTVKGRAELVVQDAASYQTLLEMLDDAEAIEGIKQGLESMRRGEGRPAVKIVSISQPRGITVPHIFMRSMVAMRLLSLLRMAWSKGAFHGVPCSMSWSGMLSIDKRSWKTGNEPSSGSPFNLSRPWSKRYGSTSVCYEVHCCVSSLAPV